ncbi:MAG: RNA methyltransferase [Opitutaceae bacterium]|nr:RNA methyltransferase [Opitutaceae bacterium]
MLTKAELQRLKSLREKKHREALGLFVIEGEKVVGELLAADFPFVELYATADWLDQNPAVGGVPSPRSKVERDSEFRGVRVPRLHEPVAPPRVTVVTPAEMERASHFPTPSRVLAVGRIQRRPLATAELGQGLTLALDGVQDAGNVGTLLRIADWFACERVLLSPDCADLFHQKVINASMGSFARVRVHAVDLPEVLAAAAELAPAPPILGCDLEGDRVHSLAGLRDAVIVIGSEGRGLSPAVAGCISRRITVPRYGRAESLNAAVAAAIVCDNLRR